MEVAGFQGYQMALASILNFFMPVSLAVDPLCNYKQELLMGQQYFIYNQEYPGYYSGPMSCQWFAIAPQNSKIVLSCEDIDIPASTNCYNDRLSISLTGNANDAHNYCGRGNITLLSEQNAILVELFAPPYTFGGRFVCSLIAIQTSPTSTTERPIFCNCGWKQESRIVGGHDTGVNEYPLMAGLLDLKIKDVFCGASIISNRYALSAAHCFYRRVITDLGLLVGDHNISTDSESNATAIYRLENVDIIDSYDPNTYQNDIAIVRTAESIKFSLYVGPVCLPFRFSADSFVNQTVTLLGWGTLEFTGQKSDSLQKVDLKVISNEYCKRHVSNPVIPEEICTFAPIKDACSGDSGGPVLWFDPNTRRLQLVGIISHGMACATASPGINTRITSYLSWIVKKTTGAVYCIK